MSVAGVDVVNGAATSSFRFWPFPALALLAGVAVTVAAYWETVLGLGQLWMRSPSYGHGFLVLPLSLYLVWCERARLARVPAESRISGIALLAGLTAAWFASDAVAVLVGKQLSLVLIIGALVWTLGGRSVARLLAFPVGYLLLTVPIWHFFVPVLQDWTALITTRVLQVFGVPVLLEGHYLTIPSGKFVVEDVCAGLSFLLATMCISALYAYLNLRTLWRAGALFALSIVLSVVFNWVRVVIIVLAGHLSSMQHFLVRDHNSFGWVVFAVGLVPLLMVGGWMRRREIAAGDPQRPAPAARGRVEPTPRYALVAVAALAVVPLGPLAAHWLAGPAASVEAGQPRPPGRIPGWQGGEAPPPEGPDWKPRLHGVDAEWVRAYTRGGDAVVLYVGYYARQRQGAEVVNDLNRFYDPGRWRLVGEEVVHPDFGPGERFSVRELRMDAPSSRTRLLWYWYVVGGHATANPLVAKVLQLWAVVTRRPGAAVVAVATESAASFEDARGVLAAFVRDAAPAIPDGLRGRSP